MQELRVRLGTVTPLLLHGADNRTPELRPPSFRGAVRYWWRAALGGVIGDKNLDGLRELEAAVFGSTERGSPISLRLGALEIQDAEPKPYLLPHKEIARTDGITGSFELILTQPRHDDALIWEAACASLELALTFGGVGQRSRRGYGALRIVHASDARAKPFPTTRHGWKAQVRRVSQQAIEVAMRIAIQILGPDHLGRVESLADYPCATNAGLIRLYDIQARTAMEAVKRFMRQTKKKPAFGGINPRQASPLWMRPIQSDSSSYGLLCTVLTSDFQGADYDYVENFLKNLGGEPLKVKGWNTL
ncbi:MAG: type III-B CRISPR module RAMP protein Cmr1 [Chloroflexota bacterium]|nr:type III-B CRISPR module RAMP protein Cmr1 [Chloroflexota bacterium]